MPLAGMTSSADGDPEPHGLRRQQQHRGAGAVDGHVDSRCADVARSRATSAAMMLEANAGWSAMRSSIVALRTRRNPLGSNVTTVAERGSGTRTASSPTVDPGPASDEDATVDEDLHAPGEDRVEAVLDGAGLDQDLAGVERHLLGLGGDGGEDAAGRGGEQVDAVQRGDPLDDQHPVPRIVQPPEHRIAAT